MRLGLFLVPRSCGRSRESTPQEAVLHSKLQGIHSSLYCPSLWIQCWSCQLRYSKTKFTFQDVQMIDPIPAIEPVIALLALFDSTPYFICTQPSARVGTIRVNPIQPTTCCPWCITQTMAANWPSTIPEQRAQRGQGLPLKWNERSGLWWQKRNTFIPK